MKKVLLSMAAVGALAAAAPAAAQYVNSNADSSVGFSSRISQLNARLQAGIQSGEVDRTEARTLRWQLNQLSRLERQYSRNGLTQAERADLQQRLRTFRQNLRMADNGRYDRDNRYGNWDDGSNGQGYAGRMDRNNDGWDDRDSDRDGRIDNGYNNQGYAGRIDRNNDGWDDRDGNRDGRVDNGYYGQGGPYESSDDYACQTRSGVGGLIDSVLGRADCGGTLRVGERATSNLYSVPSQYRYRYRDGNGVYYRSDGRSIYQIDARTNVVVRIYDID